MKTILFQIALCILFTSTSFGQTLEYKKGRIINSNNVKLTNAEVKQLLRASPENLALYKEGNRKRAFGTILFSAGLGWTIGNIVSSSNLHIKYPTFSSFIGIGITAIVIPILIGNTKKTRSAIEGYNNFIGTKKTSFNIDKLNFITNKNGIGMQLTF